MALPAEPLFASALWRPQSTSSDSVESRTIDRKLSIGCGALDKALEGGLDYGSVACISGEPDTGSREISQYLLISQLLSSPTATATFVDTGTSLDIRRLHRALAARLKEYGDAAQRAANMLDRVNVMKVFDFVGLTETISEVKKGLMHHETTPEKSHATMKVPKATIGDSDDEASDSEILEVSTHTPAPVQKPEPRQTAQNHLLIIDNVAHPLNPVLKSNYARGQSLLSSFMRSLSHLTRTYAICTVLLNGVTAYANAKDESPSIFSSCTLLPTLGKAFTYTLDMHMLVHQMPKETGRRELVSIMEVMHDRYHGRVGRWSAFTTDEVGGLVGISS